MQIPGRKNASVEVQYRGHQIEPCDAVLLLVAESGCGTCGNSMAFQLQGQVTGAKPQVHLRVTLHVITPRDAEKGKTTQQKDIV